MLYAIHGFKFQKDPSNPRQQTLDTYKKWGTGYVHRAVFDNERLIMDDSVNAATSNLLLSGVRDKKKEEESMEMRASEYEANMKAAYFSDWFVEELDKK